MKLSGQSLSLEETFLAHVLSFSVPKTLTGVPRTCVYQRAFLSEEACATPTGPQHWRGSKCHHRPIQWCRAQGSYALQPVHVQERRAQVPCWVLTVSLSQPCANSLVRLGFAFLLWVFGFWFFLNALFRCSGGGDQSLRECMSGSTYSVAPSEIPLTLAQRNGIYSRKLGMLRTCW